MRRIGLIGGITWAATLDYYRIINLETRRRLGGDHSADMVIRSLDLHPLRSRMHDVPEIERVVGEAGRVLMAAESAVIGVASFTGHRFISNLLQLPVSFIDLIESVGRHVASRRIRRLAIWATSHGLVDETLVQRLAHSTGAQLDLPGAPLRVMLDRVVFDELTAGELRPDTLRCVQGLLDEQLAAGADGMLFATTDLAPLIPRLAVDVPVFDATRIHCEALVGAALE